MNNFVNVVVHTGVQPVYANTMDIQRMALENKTHHQHQPDDTEGEATTPTTPSSQHSAQVGRLWKIHNNYFCGIWALLVGIDE